MPEEVKLNLNIEGLRNALEKAERYDKLLKNMKFRDNQLHCSFCGKGQDDVEKLIAGPGVYICNECINLCNEIIEKKKGEMDDDGKSGEKK